PTPDRQAGLEAAPAGYLGRQGGGGAYRSRPGLGALGGLRRLLRRRLSFGGSPEQFSEANQSSAGVGFHRPQGQPRGPGDQLVREPLINRETQHPLLLCAQRFKRPGGACRLLGHLGWNNRWLSLGGDSVGDPLLRRLTADAAAAIDQPATRNGGDEGG